MFWKTSSMSPKPMLASIVTGSSSYLWNSDIVDICSGENPWPVFLRQAFSEFTGLASGPGAGTIYRLHSQWLVFLSLMAWKLGPPASGMLGLKAYLNSERFPSGDVSQTGFAASFQSFLPGEHLQPTRVSCLGVHVCKLVTGHELQKWVWDYLVTMCVQGPQLV